MRLEPLEAHHVDALAAVGLDPRIWEFSRTLLADRGDVERYVAKALADRDAGTAMPFVTVERDSGRIVGSTRFESITLDERRVEVGWSWLHPSAWRTPINTEAKFLMIRHAFEAWHCVRVEFRVHVANERSLASIQKIGATVEGTLRRRLKYRDGTYRDLVYLSMIEGEWPGIRVRLEGRLYGVGT